MNPVNLLAAVLFKRASSAAPTKRQIYDGRIGDIDLNNRPASAVTPRSLYPQVKDVAAGMMRQNHPFGQPGIYPITQRDRDMAEILKKPLRPQQEFGTPAIYDMNSPWRAPMVKALRSAPSTPRSIRDLRERTNELNVPVEFHNQPPYWLGPSYHTRPLPKGPFDEQKDLTPLKRPVVAFKRTEFPAAVNATHEYEHALDDAQGALGAELRNNSWATEDDYDSKEMRNNRKKYMGWEISPVLAETVAGARLLNEVDPRALQRLRLGDPRYAQVTGRQVHDQGSRYMYGRDPLTDVKIAPQRTMSELLTRPEGRQWLQQRARRLTSP